MSMGHTNAKVGRFAQKHTAAPPKTPTDTHTETHRRQKPEKQTNKPTSQHTLAKLHYRTHPTKSTHIQQTLCTRNQCAKETRALRAHTPATHPTAAAYHRRMCVDVAHTHTKCVFMPFILHIHSSHRAYI